MNARSFVFALCLALANAAYGGTGGIVFDPTNYAQNIITAQQSVTAEIQRNTSYILQLKQYQTQLQNLTSIGTSAPSGLLSQLNTATQYSGMLNSLYGSLGGLQQQTSNIFGQKAASGQTWSQFITSEQAASNYTAGTANAWAQPAMQSMNNVQKDYSDIQAFQAKNPSAVGSQAQTQLMNDQMSMLLYQNRGIQADLDALVASQAQAAQAKADEMNNGTATTQTATQNNVSTTNQQSQQIIDSLKSTNPSTVNKW